LGIAFISVTDNLDLSTPAGRLMFHIIGAMAQFERSLIQERVRAGLRNAQSKGVRLGRPKVDIDVAKAQQLRAKGHSWRAIARELGCPLATLHDAVSGLAVVWENPKPAQGGAQ
jgi:DNA invertase Pin-like site-specific DNA recombinase